MTWQVEGGEPVQGKGYDASIAVLEDGVWKKRLLITNIIHAPAAATLPEDHPEQPIAPLEPEDPIAEEAERCFWSLWNAYRYGTYRVRWRA